MFMNVVKKAQPLFKDYPQSTNVADGKRAALANPLFSWHATYLTSRRKKVVLFTNDATTLAIVLYDVPAAERAKMQDRFQQRLAELWLTIGLSPKGLMTYSKVAKPWEIGPSVNRQQLGRQTDAGMLLEALLEGGMTDEKVLSYRVSNSMRRNQAGDYVRMSETVALLATANLTWHATPKAPAQPTADVRPAWDQLQAIDKKMRTTNVWDDQQAVTTLAKQIQTANQQLITAFMESVAEDYSAKTLKTYRGDLLFYLNEYLVGHLLTVVSEDAANVAELYEHGSSMTAVKRIRRTMSKFYKFLAANQLIDKQRLAVLQEELKDSLDLVLFELEEFRDF